MVEFNIFYVRVKLYIYVGDEDSEPMVDGSLVPPC